MNVKVIMSSNNKKSYNVFGLNCLCMSIIIVKEIL